MDTTQTVQRKRRSSKNIDNNFVQLSDLIVENQIMSKLSIIWKALSDNNEDQCRADGSLFPLELTDSLNVSANFVRTWIQVSVLSDSNNFDCPARILCKANQGTVSPTAQIVAETLR